MSAADRLGVASAGASDLTEVLERLARIVAFDTKNPPRALDTGGLFEYLAAELSPGFSVDVRDLGDGCVSLFAVRGAPSLLFNVHVDTVPADPGWTRDPLRLVITDDRAEGLGACDIKGAAACLVTAALRTRGDVALLFTSDEEAGSSRCVRHFLEGQRDFRGVVVAEPTGCRAVLEHRGIAGCAGAFRGIGGHASAPRALDDSALHEAVRWAARALEFAEAREAQAYKGLRGIRFNLGVLQGGTKSNMIAAAASLRFGARPLPGERAEDLVTAITALAPRPDRVTWETTFLAPALPAAAERVAEAEDLARALGLSPGDPVDFWTEAALFSAAGLPAIVFGPGSIAQAHTAGEWVALADLAEATTAYVRMLAGRE